MLTRRARLDPIQVVTMAFAPVGVKPDAVVPNLRRYEPRARSRRFAFLEEKAGPCRGHEEKTVTWPM